MVVVAAALTVALASTLVPAVRAARSSTVNALADAARQPHRRGTLIRVSRRLPVPLLFGLRLAARRPRRTLLSAASVAVTVCGIIAVLAFHATVNNKLSGGSSKLTNPVVSQDEQLLAVITVVLVVLAAVNTIFTAWATVLDTRHASALMRALGATAQQVNAGLVAAQTLSALPGAIIGVPLGVALFKAVAGNGTVPPPTPWLVATALTTLLVVTGLTTVPALAARRIPAGQMLHAKTV